MLQFRGQYSYNRNALADTQKKQAMAHIVQDIKQSRAWKVPFMQSHISGTDCMQMRLFCAIPMYVESTATAIVLDM